MSDRSFKCTDQGDSVDLSQDEAEIRLSKQSDMRATMMNDVLTPGTWLEFVASNSDMKNLKVKLTIDFPVGSNIVEEQNKLEDLCAKLKKEKDEDLAAKAKK